MRNCRRIALLAALVFVLSCWAHSPGSTGPGDIPPCESGKMRCWGNSIWACDTTGKWVRIQNCGATGQACYSNNPGRCGSRAPCCAGP